MPITVGSMQRKIKEFENFNIRFVHKDGRDVRDDMVLGRQYGYEKKAKDDYTVSEWIAARFLEKFPEFNCVVLDGSGAVCHGSSRLKSVRATY
ncbi:hypothetical protein OVA03_12045 [Asticcacaulis sp. SL142]|uniref:hypothetical protein n=1 Tax=Asticcacaulis sp. SL142 TaxID=2995155 RepID=UPI00226CE941|nr:hypothetical protein [Asticcacaulis sp. SL142]WAC47430.1 hypothetical protein OVA03_12045 [Asticcacaulis sp. SL142]